MSPSAAANFMKVIAVTYIIFALIAWLGAFPGFGEPSRLVFDVLKWPLDGDPGPFDAMDRWLSAIGGGLFASFGMFTLLFVAPAIARGDRQARRNSIIAVGAWFVLDSTGSIGAGAASNAFFNVLIYALFLAPFMLANTKAPA